MATLVLIRHGESVWNSEGLFTGWVDVGLSPKGVDEAVNSGRQLDEAGLRPDVVHTSLLTRAIQTAHLALESADLLLAHLVLRPFLDAYHIVADRLAAYEDEPFEEKAFLAECLQVGRQWELQRRIANAESRSMELFKTALRLAQHRGLFDGSEDIAKRRRQFADEIATATRRVNAIAELARSR